MLIYHFAEPAVPGELKPGVHAAPNVTLTFTASEGNVERYEVAVTNQTGFTNVQTITTPAVTFTGLEAGQTYDVQIVAISGGLRSDTRHDSFMVAADREFDSVKLYQWRWWCWQVMCVCVCVCVCVYVCVCVCVCVCVLVS